MSKMIRLQTLTLPFGQTQVNAFASLPALGQTCRGLAVFGHGYTSHKGQLLNWGQRLAEEGIACLLFDWPGHFLGSFAPSGPWDYFTANAQGLFHVGLERLRAVTQGATDNTPVVYGGHSLGALLALKALGESAHAQSVAIAVGLGRAQFGQGKHLFESDFYQATLNLRGQLVDAELKPERFFAWIDEQKEKLLVSGVRVYMLSGKDDMVVGRDGPEWMAQHLERQDNEVTLERPERLPHHEPELAAPFIKKFLKNSGLI